MSGAVGLGIKAAFDRAAEYQASSARRLTIRICSAYGAPISPEAFTIIATIAVREGIPSEVALFNEGKTVARRSVPWAELDARADALASLVDEAVAEVRRNFGLLT